MSNFYPLQSDGVLRYVLFLFCTPDLDTLFALDAPQPFVQLYALALGRPGSIVMTVIASLGLILVRDTCAKLMSMANP